MHASGNRIRHIGSSLNGCAALARLNLSKNELGEDCQEEIRELLRSLSSLEELDCSQNPINKIRKYREKLIVYSSRGRGGLEKLDGNTVRESERKFLTNLEIQKQKNGTSYEKLQQKAPAILKRTNSGSRLISLTMPGTTDENSSLVSSAGPIFPNGNGNGNTKQGVPPKSSSAPPTGKRFV